MVGAVFFTYEVMEDVIQFVVSFPHNCYELVIGHCRADVFDSYGHCSAAAGRQCYIP